VQAEASRLSDTVALFQALGGGWWNRPDPSNPQPDPSNLQGNTAL
jgi:outer membrane protein TolC